MLVYAKLIDGKQHLFGTMGNIPSDSDKELVYQNRDGEVVELVDNDSYNDAPNFKMEDTSEVKRFSNSMTRLSNGEIVDAFIEDAETGELFNIIPGGIEAGPQKEITKIEVKTPPIKSQYDIGEKLSLVGIEIEVTYEDEEKKIITSGFTSDPAEGTALDAEGEVTVTVSYKGKETSFEVTVVDRDKVKIYFDSLDHVPTSLDEVNFERENADQLLQAGKISKVLPANTFGYVTIAVPKDKMKITSVYLDESEISSWSDFVIIDNEEYQFAHTTNETGFEDDTVYNFIIAPAN